MFGTRQGEAFGLAKTDIDLLRKNVRIAVQVKVVGGQQVYAPVKNKKPRDVPMVEPAIPRLSEYLRRFPPVPGDAAVARTRQPEAAWPASDARLNGFHVTRHAFASACLSAGLNPAKGAALLGDTLDVTVSTYAHFLPDDDDRAREILGSFSGPRTGQVPGEAR